MTTTWEESPPNSTIRFRWVTKTSSCNSKEVNNILALSSILTKVLSSHCTVPVQAIMKWCQCSTPSSSSSLITRFNKRTTKLTKRLTNWLTPSTSRSWLSEFQARTILTLRLKRYSQWWLTISSRIPLNLHANSLNIGGPTLLTKTMWSLQLSASITSRCLWNLRVPTNHYWAHCRQAPRQYQHRTISRIWVSWRRQMSPTSSDI